MTLYLTDKTSADEIARAKASGFVHAVKYYPAGATTNSDSGVTALERAYPAIAAMERHDVVLSLHGEVTDPDVDVFDRERVSSSAISRKLVRDFPALRIVVEHADDAGGRRLRSRLAARTSPRRSRRSTCAIRATRCSPAACGRTGIACPC